MQKLLEELFKDIIEEKLFTKNVIHWIDSNWNSYESISKNSPADIVAEWIAWDKVFLEKMQWVFLKRIEHLIKNWWLDEIIWKSMSDYIRTNKDYRNAPIIVTSMKNTISDKIAEKLITWDKSIKDSINMLGIKTKIESWEVDISIRLKN